jgi:hypothetical protein
LFLDELVSYIAAEHRGRGFGFQDFICRLYLRAPIMSGFPASDSSWHFRFEKKGIKVPLSARHLLTVIKRVTLPGVGANQRAGGD